MRKLTEILKELENHPHLLKLVEIADYKEEQLGEYDEVLSEFITLRNYTIDCLEHLQNISLDKLTIK